MTTRKVKTKTMMGETRMLNIRIPFLIMFIMCGNPPRLSALGGGKFALLRTKVTASKETVQRGFLWWLTSVTEGRGRAEVL